MFSLGSSDPIDVSSNSINAVVCVKGASTGKMSVPNLEQDGANPKSIYNGTIPSITASPSIPPALPQPPPTAYRLPPLDLSNCRSVLPRIPTTSRTSGLTGTNCSSDDKFGTPYPTTFNATTDVPIGGVYSYLIDSTTSSNLSSMRHSLIKSTP